MAEIEKDQNNLGMLMFGITLLVFTNKPSPLSHHGACFQNKDWTWTQESSPSIGFLILIQDSQAKSNSRVNSTCVTHYLNCHISSDQPRSRHQRIRKLHKQHKLTGLYYPLFLDPDDARHSIWIHSTWSTVDTLSTVTPEAATSVSHELTRLLSSSPDSELKLDSLSHYGSGRGVDMRKPQRECYIA